MKPPHGYREVGGGSDNAVVRADLVELPTDFWWRDGEPLAGARGRGQVRVLSWEGGDAVVRDYRRGGALRGLNRRFLDGGRARRELAALVALRAAGVPAVEPLAALCQRHGLFYRMRLATTLLVDARPLPSFVAEFPELAAAAVREAGRVVRAAFDAGLDHPDLHPDNMVVTVADGGAVVHLLDLDRATIRGDLGERDRDRMLLRMARYLERHADSLPVGARGVDFVRFLAGMGGDRSARRREIERLRTAYERAVARHRVVWRK